MLENIKKVRVKKTLLCHGGPVGGYAAGDVFEAPFPDGIARELKADSKNILNGKGTLEILNDGDVDTEKPVKEWKKKTS